MSNDEFLICPHCVVANGDVMQPLYAHNRILECPIHGVYTNREHIAEWERDGTLFLLGRPPQTETPPASCNGDNA